MQKCSLPVGKISENAQDCLTVQGRYVIILSVAKMTVL